MDSFLAFMTEITQLTKVINLMSPHSYEVEILLGMFVVGCTTNKLLKQHIIVVI